MLGYQRLLSLVYDSPSFSVQARAAQESDRSEGGSQSIIDHIQKGRVAGRKMGLK